MSTTYLICAMLFAHHQIFCFDQSLSTKLSFIPTASEFVQAANLAYPANSEHGPWRVMTPAPLRGTEYLVLGSWK